MHENRFCGSCVERLKKTLDVQQRPADHVQVQ